MTLNQTVTIVGLVCGLFMFGSWILVWVAKIQADHIVAQAF